MRPVVKLKNLLGFKIWLEKLDYEVKHLDGGFVARAKAEKEILHFIKGETHGMGYLVA